MMPGQSGLDVLAEVRADPELETLPVVVVSAFSSEDDRRAAAAAGADRFLAKPFEPDDLVSMVEELLREAR
jgi:DNA-binding response OmpR family regulator